MDVTDYTKKLSSERQDFYDKVQKNNRNQKEEIDNIKTTSNSKVEKQLANHLKERAKLEEIYKDRYEEMSATQKKALSSKSEDYKEALKQNQEEFHELRKGNVKGFSEKLARLNKNYKKTLDHEREHHAKMQANSKDNYSDRVDSILSKSDKDIKKYDENATSVSKKFHEKMQTEKKELISGYEDKLEKLQKDELEKRNFLKTKITKDVEGMRKVQTDERISNREKADRNFKRLTENSNRKVASVESQNTKELADLRESQKSELKKQGASFSKRFAEQQEEYDKDVRRMALDNKLNGIGSGSKNAKLQDEMKKLDRLNTEKRVGRILTERKNLENRYTEKFDNAMEEFKNTYRSKNIDKANAVELLKNEKSNDMATQKAEYEVKLEESNKLKEKVIADQKNQSSEALSETQLNSRNQLKRLKEEFSKTIEDSVVKSQTDFQMARDEMNAEKTEAAETLKKNSNAVLKNLKKENLIKVSKMTQSYETRINKLENQNKALVDKMENMGEFERNMIADKFRRREEIIKQEAKTMVEAKKLSSDAKEMKLQKNITDLQKNYDKKMILMQNRKDNEVKKMNFSFKKDIQDTKDKLTRKMDQNQLNFDRELARIKAASASEKSNLVTQYEERIKKLEGINNQKVKEIKEFNEFQKA